MGITWRRTDPLANHIVRPVSSRATIYLAVLQRTQQAAITFTLAEGEDPEPVAWELAEREATWVATDKTALSVKQIRE